MRAGTLGLPLMVAIIGGETHRFRPLVDLYKEAGRRAGHAPETAASRPALAGLCRGNDAGKRWTSFFPGYAQMFTQNRPRARLGAGVPRSVSTRRTARPAPCIVGGPEEARRENARRHSATALGGVSRVTLQMDGADLPHADAHGSNHAARRARQASDINSPRPGNLKSRFLCTPAFSKTLQKIICGGGNHPPLVELMYYIAQYILLRYKYNMLKPALQPGVLLKTSWS